MNLLNAAQRMQMIERFETLTVKEYKALNDEIEQLRQRVAELEKERDELIEVKAAENASWNAGFNVQADQIAKLTAERDELLAALINHQEQTRPIQQTIDAIASVKEK